MTESIPNPQESFPEVTKIFYLSMKLVTNRTITIRHVVGAGYMTLGQLEAEINSAKNLNLVKEIILFTKNESGDLVLQEWSRPNFEEDGLRCALVSLRRIGMDTQTAMDVINEMLNDGVLFRERI